MAGGRRSISKEKAEIKSIKIAPFDYALRIDPEAQDECRALGAAGLAKHEEQEILVRTDIHVQDMKDTLVHECLHAMWTQTDLKRNKKIDKYQERVIWSLTPRLLGWMRDNPRLVTYLMEEA